MAPKDPGDLPRYVPHLLDRVRRENDHVAARTLCSLLAHYLKNWEPTEPELRGYLINALEEAAEGGSMDKALGLKPTHGKARMHANRELFFYVCTMYALLLRDEHPNPAAGTADLLSIRRDIQYTEARIKQIWQEWAPKFGFLEM